MSKVKNQYGAAIDFDAARKLMDGTIREMMEVVNPGSPDQVFFNRYCAEHLRKYGEDFAPDMQKGER